MLNITPSDNADALNNQGVAFYRLGRVGEAIACYQRALAIKPDFVDALGNLGVALCRGARFDDAIACLRRAVALRPDFADAYNTLASAYKARENYDDALACYHRALEINPNYVEAHNNLGNTWRTLGFLDAAIACYRQALALKPDFAAAHSSLLLCLHYQGAAPAVILQEHQRWAERYARPFAGQIAPHANDRAPERRLRIGYVSPDFRSHAVAYFIESLLAHHDRAGVEVFCYANVVTPDAVTARLQQYPLTWRNIVGRTDEQAADLVRQDQIDILVDLAGHMAFNRIPIFARKPAPIQVAYLGYPGTTGLDTIDYRLTDAFCDPPGRTESFYSESLVRLPDTFACYRPAPEAPPPADPPAVTRGYPTLASFHALVKLRDPVLECWAQILREVPHARLLMVAPGLEHATARRRLADFFAARDIAAARLEFLGRQPLQKYFELHQQVDVLLDCFPCTGHTIACHALWMGVPVVTLAGDRYCARMVASVLTTLGLPDLVASTPDQYVQIAKDLAGDLPRLTRLHATLRPRMQASPLTDASRFAAHVEAAYRTLWQRWCSSPS